MTRPPTNSPLDQLARRLIAPVAGLAVVAAACSGPAEAPDGGASPSVTSFDGATPTLLTLAPPSEPPGAGSPDVDTPAPADDEPAGDATPPAAATGTLPMGRLVYDSERDDNLDIYILDAGATEPQRITTHEGNDRVGSLSPDGTRIVFQSDRDGGPDSPTGLRSYALYVVEIGGEPQHLLGTRSFNGSAMFSPDGTQIAFDSDASGTRQIYLISADGSGSPTALTDDPVAADMGGWSPDGTQIVFSTYRHSEGTEYQNEIYVMDADGSQQTRLTDDPAKDYSGTWSPVGDRIAFVSERGGTADVYVMNADGSGLAQLTDLPGDERSPTWSPDGSMLAFDYYFDDDHEEIYLVNADGSGLVNLTNSPFRDAFPYWGSAPGEAPAVPSSPAATTPGGDASPTGAVGAGDAVAVEWFTTGQGVGAETGETVTVECPPGGTPGGIYGTDEYTDDSSICTAAVHAGLISFGSGGEVTIELRSGRDSFEGSTRNGVTSLDYGAWPRSFIFIED